METYRPPHQRGDWQQTKVWQEQERFRRGCHVGRPPDVGPPTEWQDTWWHLCALAGAIWGVVWAFQQAAERHLQYDLSMIPLYLVCAIGGYIIGALVAFPLLVIGPLAIIYFVFKWLMTNWTG